MITFELSYLQETRREKTQIRVQTWRDRIEEGEKEKKIVEEEEKEKKNVFNSEARTAGQEGSENVGGMG